MLPYLLLEKIASTPKKLLKSGGYRVFYDEYEIPHLQGKNLYDELSSVYQNQAHYCVMFLSEHYAHKWWPKNERESAQTRAFVTGSIFFPFVLTIQRFPGS